MGATRSPVDALGTRPVRRSAPPPVATHSRLVREAYEAAREAHHGERRRGDTDIGHPVAVAEVLVEHGVDEEEILAAALLHDVLEDTETDADELGDRFGPRVIRLVEGMTEDRGIEPYADRKAEHRERVVRDRDVAAIYAADKLAKVRRFRAGTDEPAEEQLAHYRATVELLSDTHPDLPSLPELRRELARLRP